MKTVLTSIKTLIFGIIFIYFWGWISLLTRYFDRLLGWKLPGWMTIPGYVLIIFGGILAVSTAFTFVFFGEGTPAPFDAPVKFVGIGPYRFVRNPMYWGGFLLLEGYAFVNLSVSMALFPLSWFLIVHFFVIYYEEKTLQRKFGQSYNEYKSKVNRWLPRFPPNYK